MYGLIKKDLFMIRQNLKILLLIFILFLFMTAVNESNMIFMFPFMAVMISISTFSYDNYNKWDAYAVTLPNGRKNVVRVKYISTLVFIMVSFGVAALSLFLTNKCGVNFNLTESIAELVGCLLAVFLIMSVMFPIIYKYGVEKGRIALFVISFGITGLAVLILKEIDIDIPTNIIEFFKSYYKIIIPMITGLLVFISYLISEKIYLKKEF